ncbi:uncharacterized protein N7483_006990 [Penicillium malachiteum]|uniref:uncharacterized protein n=1 Tax=Penicillium malachiteum TaxID=1324776 RepID=UPI00254914C3|nr:uncharacterized protein N7483_006990 [Penicillium malachiteum]KAJ5725633.1 hypothetical protein N7483_006990 [Penicillium malachiteum]
MATISELVQNCFAQFNSLIKSELLVDCTEVSLQDWRDELGRLRVWAANIGAHQTRQSSLDYRLRDASHIKSQIVVLLGQVQELLTDLEDVLEEQDDEGSQIHDSEYIDDVSESEPSMSEIQEIHEGLVDTIGQLYQMSMLIRKPSQHDRLVGTEKADSEPFQFWAKSHTSEKYPNADPLAIDRISSAMARQRAVLKYRERHHEKLGKGIDPEGDGKSTVLSETVVTDVFKEIPGQISDLISEAGVSETSYGGTLLEGTGSDAPKIPPRPKGAENGPFECPYCFYIITAKDKKSWARHIFRDLMPYVCIFPECPTPNKLYESRRQWHHHITQAHVNSTAQKDNYDCSICRRDSLPMSNFQKHVGQHLEELALFLLPRTDSDSDEDENGDTDEEKEGNSTDENASEASVNGYLEEDLTENPDITDSAEVLSESNHIDDTLSEELRNQSEDRPSPIMEYSSDPFSIVIGAAAKAEQEEKFAHDREVAREAIIMEERERVYKDEEARAKELAIAAEDMSAHTTAELFPENHSEKWTENDHHPESEYTAKITNTTDLHRGRSTGRTSPENGAHNPTEDSDDEVEDLLVDGSPATHTRNDRQLPSSSISADANESDLPRNLLPDQGSSIDLDDMEQNRDIEKQQEEVEDLKRHLAKLRAVSETREMTREEEEEYEKYTYETLERARRVEQHERDSKKRAAQGKKPSEAKLRELEEGEGTKPEGDGVNNDLDHEMAPEIDLKTARQEREKIRKRILEMEDKEKKSVEEWEMEEAERAKRDLEFRNRLRDELGYDEKEIDEILNKKSRDEGKKTNERDKGKSKENILDIEKRQKLEEDFDSKLRQAEAHIARVMRDSPPNPEEEKKLEAKNDSKGKNEEEILETKTIWIKVCQVSIFHLVYPWTILTVLGSS